MFLDFITNYFYPFTCFQSTIIALFLFSLKKGSQNQNKLLALFFLSFGVMILSRFLWRHPAFEKHYAILTIGVNFRFFIGPLFYLYLRSIFKPSQKFKKTDLLHAGLFIFLLLNVFINNYFDWIIYVYLDVLQISVYVIWSFFKFRLIYLFIKPILLKNDIRQVFWLQFFIISNIVTLLFIILLLLFLSKIIYIPNWDSWFARLVTFSNFIFINSTVYFALKIPDLYISLKYKNGELPDAIQKRYVAKLANFMEGHKPYLNPSLSLNSLADELSISPKHLSKIINNSFQQNFYHYINSYRIEECKKMFIDETNNQKNIMTIAFECGFNSKNTFNSAFKKATDMTPTEFRKRQFQK